MKHERISVCMIGMLLSLGVSLGAAGCFVTAFDLNVETAFLLKLCIGTAAGSAVLFSLRYGSFAVASVTVLAGIFCLRQGNAPEQFRQLFFTIAEIYASAYDWIILPGEYPVLTQSPYWPVGIYAAAAAILTAVCVVRGKSLWCCLPVVLLPQILVSVVTDTVPSEGYLMLLLGGLCLLILPNDVRKESVEQANRLTVMAVAPVVAVILLLFALIPQEGYVNQSAEVREDIRNYFQTIPERLNRELNTLVSEFQKIPQGQVTLSELGQQNPSDQAVLEVLSDRSEPLYLRGQDFDCYDGRAWTSTESRREEFGLVSRVFWNVTVTTYREATVQYIPYYPRQKVILSDGAAKNTGKLTQTITCCNLEEGWRHIAYGDGEEIPLADEARYLVLPEKTRQGARALLTENIQLGGSNTEKADLIGALVSSTAKYDLQPQSVPENAEDFALWFLREAETGYCTHFATAAVVLLRAAEVPARYVTGYLVKTEAGKPVVVSEKEAHGWAEYYEPRLGCWIVLEATPAAGLPVPPVETQMPTQPLTQAPAEHQEHPTEVQQSFEEVYVSQQSDAEALPLPQKETPAKQGGYVPVLISLLVVVVVVQRKLRLSLRQKRMQIGSSNERALTLWRESSRLSRLVGEVVPMELTDLAEKAKYSQHELSEAELEKFTDHNRRCIEQLHRKCWYRRLIDQYFRAAY